MRKSILRQRLLVSAIAALNMGMVHAESADDLVLEEVIIYAQKREQTILEVPVAVSAYSGDALEKAQIRDLTDLQQVAPSLVYNSSSGGGESILTIRGIGTAGQNAGLEQSVGVFIDGVYRGRPGSALTDYVGVESVEVLRGPQGTLFGRNTSAGVISVRTKKASYEFGGSVDVGVGSDGYKQTKFTVTGPLIEDTLAYRLSGSYQEKDGYIEDEFTGEDFNDRDRNTVRGELFWDINDSSSLRVIADYTDTNEKCCVSVPYFYGPSQALISAPAIPFPGLQINAPTIAGTPGSYSIFSGNYIDYEDYNSATTPSVEADDSFIDGGLSLEYKRDLSDSMELTVIASERFFETNPVFDADQTPADIINSDRTREIDETSFEMRLSSAGDGDLDWTVGMHYFDQQIQNGGGLYWGEHGAAYLASVGIARGAASGVLSGTGSLVNPGFVANPAIAGTGATESVDYQAKSVAVFGQATWHLSEQLSLGFGLRYSDEEKDADYSVTSTDPYSQTVLPDVIIGTDTETLFNALRPLQVMMPVNPVSDSYEDDNLSGSISVNYVWSEDLSTYARFAKGYKSGGLNLNGTGVGVDPGNPVASLEGNQFDAEETDAFEIGAKAYFLDQRLQVNAAAFFQKVSDFQANSFDGVSFTLRNAGELESKGVELDYRFLINENWSINGGFVFQDVEYAEFDNASTTATQQQLAGLDARANGTVPPANRTGETPNFVSDVTSTGTVNYRTELSEDLVMNVSVGYRYRSDYTTGQDNDDYTRQDDFTTVNMSASIASADDTWALELWGKNITDETVINIGYDSVLQTGSYNYFLEAPMSWGVTGRYNF